MKSLKTMTNALLLAAGLASGVGLTARAQTITLNGTTAAATAAQVGGGGLQYACTAYAPASPQNQQTFVFTPGANNEVIDKWTLQGDGVATTGTTGTTFSFSPIGFGKARVTVNYYYNTGATTPVFCSGGTVPITCPGGGQLTTPVRAYATRSYDFFKVFTKAQAGFDVKGPTCVPVVNPSVVYSVEPGVISTQNQIAAGIDIDKYTWTVTYTSGLAIGTNVPRITSGDGSTITIPQTSYTGPNAGSFKVAVKVGTCNTVQPDILVTLVGDLGASVSNFPACIPIGSTASTSFTLNTVAGVNYTLNTTIGLLSSTTPVVIPAANSIAITGTGNAVTVNLTGITTTNTGTVTISGVGGNGNCFGTQTIVRQVTRQLVGGTNLITPVCVTPNSTAVLTLSNAPQATAGQAINWVVPTGAGWAITSGQGTNAITVTTGAAAATITAQAGTCNNGGTGIISQAVGVSGPVSGCNLTISNSGGATPGCSFTASVPAAPCPLNNANRYTTWRLYDLSRPLPVSNQLVETVTVPLNFQSTGSISFAYQTSIAGTARVEVDVVNTAPGGSCLRSTFGTSGLDFVFCPPGGRAAAPGSSAAAKLARQEVRAYPNPSNGLLTVDLTPAEGTTQLSLVDALGRTVQTTTTDHARAALDVRGLPEGTYTLRAVRPGGKVLTQTVQVQH